MGLPQITPIPKISWKLVHYFLSRPNCAGLQKTWDKHIILAGVILRQTMYWTVFVELAEHKVSQGLDKVVHDFEVTTLYRLAVLRRRQKVVENRHEEVHDHDDHREQVEDQLMIVNRYRIIQSSWTGRLWETRRPTFHRDSSSYPSWTFPTSLPPVYIIQHVVHASYVADSRLAGYPARFWTGRLYPAGHQTSSSC